MAAEEKHAREYTKGHRARRRNRYRLSGDVALQDYELLELLLTFAIPHRDTKLLAKRLLERSGTLARTFEAEPQALEEIDGIGPQAATPISLIRPLAVRFLDHLIIGEATPFSFKANGLL